MKLAVVKQAEIMQCASLGMSLYDSLIVAGIPPAEAEQRQRDREVVALWKDGRAQGIRDIRACLAREARAGNVSAMKALRLHDPDYIQDEEGEQRPVIDPALTRGIATRVRVMFQRQRQLQLEADAEAG